MNGNGKLLKSALVAAGAAALQAAALALMSPDTDWRTITASAALAAGVSLRAYLSPRPQEQQAKQEAWKEAEELRDLLQQTLAHQHGRLLRMTHDDAK